MSVRGADGTELDVRVRDGSVGGVCLNIRGLARVGGASTTSNTGGGGVLVERVAGVEPEHVGRMVIPDGHDQDHTGTHSSAHWAESTLGLEVVNITEGNLLVGAERGGDRVVFLHAGDVGLRVLDDFAALDVDTADFAERAARGVVAGQELSDNGHLLGAVDGLSFAPEGLVTHAVRVEIASILVAHARVPLVGGVVTAGGTGAASRALSSARVRGIGGTHRVCLPDVHLIAACSVFAASGILIVIGGLPVDHVSLRAGMSVNSQSSKVT